MAEIIDLTAQRGFNPGSRSPRRERTAIAELRRARVRIAQLERSLTMAMQDSLTNFNRARDAERRLDEVLDREG